MLDLIQRWRRRTRGRRSAASLRHKFLDMQPEIGPDLFIEVGAYDGSTSLAARRRLPHARVVAFEAHPTNHLRFSKELQHSASGVEYVHSAIADSVGNRPFRIILGSDDNQDMRSSLLGRTESKWEQIELSVPCTTLDEFFADRMPSRCCLWVDVEGASREVLLGASNILSVTEAILIEVEDRPFWHGQWLAEDVRKYLALFDLRTDGRDFEYRQQHNELFRRCSAK